MADISLRVPGGIATPDAPDGTVSKRFRDVGGGQHAEEVALARSGFTATASFTPAAAAYGAGDIMDVAKAMSFADHNGVLLPAGSLIRVLTAVVKIDITAVPSGQTNYQLQCYSVTPPSAQADNDAWALASGDLASYLGPINLGTPADLGGALYIKTQYVDTDIRLAGTGLFAQLVTVGGHTAAAVPRQVTLHAVVL
jgi:hypothetical protein